MIIYNSHMPSITKNSQKKQYQTSPEFSTSFNVGKPMSETTHCGNGQHTEHTTYLILFMVMFMALFYPPIYYNSISSYLWHWVFQDKQRWGFFQNSKFSLIPWLHWWVKPRAPGIARLPLFLHVAWLQDLANDMELNDGIWPKSDWKIPFHLRNPKKGIETSKK